MTGEDEKADYDLLLPHISALPEITKINVNTATPAVIASIDGSLAEKAEELSRWSDSLWELYPECENIFDISQLVAKATNAAVSENDKSPYETLNSFIADAGLTASKNVDNNNNNNNNNVSGADSTNEGASNGSANRDFTTELSVISDYFQIRIEVETGEVALSQFSLVKRAKTGANTVLQRSRNVF